MRVAVGSDQGDDIDPVAADLFHHVAEDRERGDGLELVRRFRPARQTEKKRKRQACSQERTFVHDTTLLG